ncbi:hypothetical protein A2T98_17350 [Nodularia spumigena CENA596]|uniref:Uncharacterized protein n=1 Tax=Nodularia spumigena CENA596 TaxID=1819295 RepID=A0A166ILN8_NODSP|nr:hypothetical protein A2T98_17350 [Nodularia spumigena CENA596]
MKAKFFRQLTVFSITGFVMMSVKSICFAQGMVVMKSDRTLEYNYTWRGHAPRGRAECFQEAGKELVASLNQMGNIQEFDRRTGANTERTLSNQFENIGKLIRNKTTFIDSRTQSTISTGTQRGLIVSVRTLDFKDGTYYQDYKRRWDGVRNSKCGGTLLYKFIVYGPNNLQSTRPGTSTPTKGRSVVFHNRCRYPVKLAMRYRQPSGEWKTSGWWNFVAGRRAYLTQNEVRISSNNSVFYYYAQITQGPHRNYKWSGNENRKFSGRTLPMKKTKLPIKSNGNYELSISCNNITT